jgi:hypothetical protein
MHGLEEIGPQPRSTCPIEPDVAVDHDGLRLGIDSTKYLQQAGELSLAKVTGHVLGDGPDRPSEGLRGLRVCPGLEDDARGMTLPLRIVNINRGDQDLRLLLLSGGDQCLGSWEGCVHWSISHVVRFFARLPVSAKASNNCSRAATAATMAEDRLEN